VLWPLELELVPLGILQVQRRTAAERPVVCYQIADFHSVILQMGAYRIDIQRLDLDAEMLCEITRAAFAAFAGSRLDRGLLPAEEDEARPVPQSNLQVVETEPTGALCRYPEGASPGVGADRLSPRLFKLLGSPMPRGLEEK
jgi:hypothetical protein